MEGSLKVGARSVPHSGAAVVPQRRTGGPSRDPVEEAPPTPIRHRPGPVPKEGGQRCRDSTAARQDARKPYPPESRTSDRERCRAPGVPDARAFATRTGLARSLPVRAHASLPPVAGPTADALRWMRRTPRSPAAGPGPASTTTWQRDRHDASPTAPVRPGAVGPGPGGRNPLRGPEGSTCAVLVLRLAHDGTDRPPGSVTTGGDVSTRFGNTTPPWLRLPCPHAREVERCSPWPCPR